MLDCRGLACPQPVMRAKELLESQSPPSLEVLVDNAAASANVKRFLESQGYSATVTPQGGDYLIAATLDPDRPKAEAPPAEAFTCTPETARHVVFVRADTLGRGDDELGRGLMKNFLATLKEMGPALWRIMFVNSGVKLCVADSPCLESLKALQDDGVSILVCGTCLDFFKLLDQKEVGETTNMLDIVTSLQAADKVITI